VPSEVDVFAVVDDEVLSGAIVAGALVSAIDNRAHKVIVGSVRAAAAVIAVAAVSAACNIKDE
jgi:hypothetical protein